jgi:hypothetical protein
LRRCVCWTTTALGHRPAEIYTNGKELCENMFDDAFKYEEDEDKGFVMWFFGDNPNAKTADSLDSLAHISVGMNYSLCHRPDITAWRIFYLHVVVSTTSVS